MERMTFHVDANVAEAVRQDAAAKGQSLSVWFLRAAIAALQPSEADDFDRMMAPAKAKFLVDMLRIDREQDQAVIRAANAKRRTKA